MTALAFTRVRDESIAKMTAPNLDWPNNVPSTATAITLMYEPQRLPPLLHAPTLELLTVITAKNLAAPPEGLALEAWLKALAVTWRLKASAALAKQARRHDEHGLQAMFDEAAEVRAWLLELANKPGFSGQLEAQALRGLLQAAWGEVLNNAPPPPNAATVRPPARTGKTGIYRAITGAPRARTRTRPEAAPVGSAPRLRGVLVFAALAVAITARVFLVEGDLEASLQAPVQAQPDEAPAGGLDSEGAMGPASGADEVNSAGPAAPDEVSQ